jgi:Ni,Fe-hydrogenase I cytochrome b subunit
MLEVRNHSRGLRIWHWLDALVVTGLIATYFLRGALVSNTRFLVQKLSEGGLAVTDAVSRPIQRQLVQRLWVWHIDLGYVLTALLLVRVVLLFTDKRNPAADSWRALNTLRGHFDFRNVHSAAVKSGYVVFYLLQAFMVLSGLTLVFGESLGVGKDFRHLLSQTHEAAMWFFLAFALAHITGVFFAENTGDPGIVSSMINGGSTTEGPLSASPAGEMGATRP